MTARLTASLLAWYDGRERDVPWRGETDPYRIWVAEVMAQQTRVETVRAYHRRFLERFPDVESLARAPLDDVLLCWQGLGYYTRARNLHAAAGRVVAERGGALPETAAELSELPGIGPYTAGAIASFAFGEGVPAIDGNARRVLARAFDLDDPGPSRLREAARRLLDAAPGRAAEINQALMDLGSEVCRGRAPRCGGCPIAGGCLALRAGTVDERPRRPAKRPMPRRLAAAGAIAREGRVLMVRRPERGLLGGLWDLPWVDVGGGSDARRALSDGLEPAYAVRATLGARLATVDHAFSHFRLTLEVFSAVFVSSAEDDPTAIGDIATGDITTGHTALDPIGVAWVRPEALDGLATPTYLRSVIPLLRG